MSSVYRCFLICIFTVMAWSAVVKRGTRCPEAYRRISSKHTMCLRDVGTIRALTLSEKRAALKEHNDIRARVSPAAADMLKLKWDEDLASVAAKWAAQCVLAHDKIRALPKLPGVWVGQNLAAHSRFMNLVEAIRFWESEMSDFRYGRNSTGVVGHYTQIVNAKTARVGCGIAACSSGRWKSFQVCNYAVGQSRSSLTRPYKRGSSSCDACPDSCDSSGKLCDCGGKMCLNRRSLDVNTCRCS